jgi:hypothetical protein
VTIAALTIALLGCAFILFIGVRFLLAPKIAMAGFGVPADSLRALTSIKGVRDITSGAVPLVALAAGGTHVFGWVMLTAAITPIGDAVIVRTNGGTLRQALSVHAVTAALLVAVGLILVLA